MHTYRNNQVVLFLCVITNSIIVQINVYLNPTRHDTIIDNTTDTTSAAQPLFVCVYVCVRGVIDRRLVNMFYSIDTKKYYYAQKLLLIIYYNYYRIAVCILFH